MATFLILALLLLSLAYFWYRIRKPKKPGTLPNPDFEDFNAKFLRNPGSKVGTADLVQVYHADDLNLLRSLLDAEGIESFVLESRMGALYPLSSIPGFTDSTITVYESDWEPARQIVLDYLSGYPEASGIGRTPPLLVPHPDFP